MQGSKEEAKTTRKSDETPDESQSNLGADAHRLEYLNKSACRPPLKSLSRISNNVRQAATGLDSRSLFQPLFRLGLACISERVRFRDFNWLGGIPLRGLYFTRKLSGDISCPPGDGRECTLSFSFFFFLFF